MLLTLLACTPGDTTQVAVGQVAVELLNPTTADPWAGVESVALELVGDEGVVESAVFGVDEAMELPELDRFGRVRIELRGLDGAGALLSYGRTRELVVGPEQELAAVMLFLPVDRELELDLSFVDRSDHAALSLEDGSVLLVGGGTPGVERYELDQVAQLDPLQKASSRPAWTWSAERQGFVVGGAALIGQAETPVRDALLVDPLDGSVEELPKLQQARVPSCLAVFRREFGIVLGGEEAAETLRRDPDSGEWEWTRVLIGDLDGSRVTGCVLAEDGRVVMLGEGAGVFDFRAETAQANPKIAEAFALEPFEGSLGLPVSGPVVWTDAGREYELDSLAGRESLAPSGEVLQALGGGDDVVLLYADAVELVDLEARLGGPLVDLTPTDGSRVNVLPGGVLFISGPQPRLVRPRPW